MQLLPKIALTGLLTLALAGAAETAQAQVTINVNPPSWGPAVPAGKQYYYVPEYGGYYDVRDQQYIVQRDGRWTRVGSINGYNVANFHPVVIDYVGTQPWVLIGRHRQLYPASLPPGQVKRLENGKGLPPGQAKKLGYGGNGNGRGHGKGKH
ncbi:hypothetical protein [Hymenobacter sp. 102]|uniref:hypothetical protein n=1 Tax=Hymenobacter sp. 102 TaxID=3403152 RepID=UPI003CEB962B